jgi:hypothetical protein
LLSLAVVCAADIVLDSVECIAGVNDGDAVEGFEIEELLVAGDNEIDRGGERAGEDGIVVEV